MDENKTLHDRTIDSGGPIPVCLTVYYNHAWVLSLAPREVHRDTPKWECSLLLSLLRMRVTLLWSNCKIGLLLNTGFGRHVMLYCKIWSVISHTIFRSNFFLWESSIQWRSVLVSLRTVYEEFAHYCLGFCQAEERTGNIVLHGKSSFIRSTDPGRRTLTDSALYITASHQSIPASSVHWLLFKTSRW